MNPTSNPSTRRAIFASLLVVSVGLVGAVPSAHAAGRKKNPASKVYVSEVSGESRINTGERIEDLGRRSVYAAQGTVIETKPKSSNTLVFSNGTAVFYGADTRVEMRRFSQEPFAPNRTDLDQEPSISQTQAFVARGTVGLCTSKLVAGSNMNYATPHGSVNIQGGKVVIQVFDNHSIISMLEGDHTVRAGDQDMGGKVLHTGEQAVIRPGPVGEPGTIEILKIPDAQLETLQEYVALACTAKRTVYFDVNDGANAFTGGTSALDDGEIVVQPVIPVDPPTGFTVSPANLPNTPGPG